MWMLGCDKAFLEETLSPITVLIQMKKKNLRCFPSLLTESGALWGDSPVVLLIPLSPLWTELCPSKFICWSPNTQCDFKIMAFKRVIKVNEVIWVGPKSISTGVLIRKGDNRAPLPTHTQTKDRKQVAICKPWREASPEMKFSSTLILDFFPPEPNSFGLCSAICGILLWHPEQTDAVPDNDSCPPCRHGSLKLGSLGLQEGRHAFGTITSSRANLPYRISLFPDLPSFVFINLW